MKTTSLERTWPRPLKEQAAGMTNDLLLKPFRKKIRLQLIMVVPTSNGKDGDGK